MRVVDTNGIDAVCEYLSAPNRVTFKHKELRILSIKEKVLPSEFIDYPKLITNRAKTIALHQLKPKRIYKKKGEKRELTLAEKILAADGDSVKIKALLKANNVPFSDNPIEKGGDTE